MSKFYDRAKIFIKAGKGGDGLVAFLREKYRPDGGPAGGDGGCGGSVIIKVDEGLHNLSHFRYHSHFKARNGENGMTKSRYGKGAEDLILTVPPGTIIRDAKTHKLVADLLHHEDSVCVAQGGRGGRGNKKFATHNNPAPEMAENGEPGEEVELNLELRVLADVGIIGFPSVGKSTILSVATNAKPKIATYPFTTLSPNLGVVNLSYDETFVMADLPGLIEGAGHGVGLGLQFLQHVKRTKVLLHVIDMASLEGRDPYDDYLKINHELAEYDEQLLDRPTIIVANKMDMPAAADNLKAFTEKLENEQNQDEQPEIIEISAYTHQGIKELLRATFELLEDHRDDFATGETIINLDSESDGDSNTYFKLKPIKEGFWQLSGAPIEKDFKMANLEFDESARRFAKKMAAKGVDDALLEAGAQNGDIVRILDYEFEFFV